MKTNLTALLVGVAFGVVLSWARLTDPAVIRNMLLLREADVFLLMGSAVVTAAIGTRLLRAARLRAIATGDAISWQTDPIQARHFIGSALFGAGWAAAGTCPGPVAAMIGQGRWSGLWVALGIAGGALLQGLSARARAHQKATALPEAPGL